MVRVPLGRGVKIRVAVVGLLTAMSCGGGSCGGLGGCGGCSDGSYEFPEGDPARPDAVVLDDVLRVRITQDFLDFIRPQLPAVIGSQLGNQGGGMYVDANNILHIPIPDQTLFDIGVAEAEMRDAEALLWLDDLSDRLDIKFEEPNGARLTIDMIRIGVQLKLKEEVVGADSSCPVFGDLGGPPVKHAAEISVNALIDPGVGPDPDYNLDIQIGLDSIALDDLAVDVAGSSVYCQEPECRDCAVSIGGTCLDPGGRCVECDIFCGGITNAVVSLATSLIDLVRPLLNSLLRPVIEGILGDLVNDLNGSSAKVESQLSLADLAGIEALRRANPLGIFAAPVPGRFPVVNRSGLGMEITMNAGVEGEKADCIGDLAPFMPMPGPVPEPPATDSRSRPYHLWTTFGSTYLNQFLYAAHRSGTLCMKLSSEDVRELTGGSFTLNASLLSLLASDLSKLATDRAPVILELKPRNPGFIELGSGQVVGMDAMGNEIYDWLMQLTLDDIGVAFHVFSHDRFVRVFEVTTDVFIGLNVNVLPDNTLQVEVGELRIDDFAEDFNEVVPNANFAEVLPTLLDLALGAFLNQSLTFDLDIADVVSDALGGAPIYLRVNEIGRDGVQEDYLSLTMTMTSSRTTNLTLAAETYARLHPTEDGLVERVDGVMTPTGRIRLIVGEGLPYDEQRALEYAVRVDGGLWRASRPARPDGTLFVADPKLKMPGPHLVEVRSRYAGDYTSLDVSPASIHVVVDPFAPQIRALHEDTGVRVDVVDLDTLDVSQLVLEAKTDDGAWYPVDVRPWSEGTARGVLAYGELGGADILQLRARDPKGNESSVATVRLGLQAETTTEPQATGCACTASESRSGFAWFALLGLGLLLRRRRG